MNGAKVSLTSGWQGKKLGLLVDDTLVYDDETELDNMQDFMLYHSQYKGMRVLDLFYDSDVELDDLEELVLEGKVNSFSKYKILMLTLIGVGSF